MVQSTDISTLIEGYLSEKKLAHIEALLMWSKGISPETIASVLRNRYPEDGGIAYREVISDLSDRKITSVSDITEDTRERISAIIEDLFNSKCVDAILDAIREKFKAISTDGKKLLLALVRSGLFMEEAIDMEKIELVYRTLFEERPTSFWWDRTLGHLEKIGFLYRDRSSYRGEKYIKVPKYVLHLLPEIEDKIRAKNAEE
jgi:hypothetical protein